MENELRIGTAFSTALAEGVRRIREGEAAARQGDPEGVHLIRTSARRLRAAVKYLGGALPNGKSLANDLRRFMNSLGPVRDFDVLLAAIGSATILQPGDAEKLKASVVRKRERAQAVAAGALDGELYRNLMAQLEACVNADPAPLNLAAPGRIFRALETVLAGKPADWKVATDDSLHETRKSIKKLRYSLEAFRPAYGKPVERLIDRCRELQEAFGSIQDGATFAGRLRGVRTFAAGQFLATAKARADFDRERIPLLWRRAFGGKILARLGAHLLRRAVREPQPEAAPEFRAVI